MIGIRAALVAAALALCQVSNVLAQTPPNPPPLSAIGGYTELSATNLSVATQLPTSVVAYGAVTLYNSGAKDAYFAIGGPAITATTSPTGNGAAKIPAGISLTFWVPGSYIAVVTGGADTTTVLLWQGTGTLSFSGGGGTGGGGGGGGAITMANGSVSAGAYSAGSLASGAIVDLGLVADAASSAGGTGTVSAKLRLMTTQLGTINTTLGTPFQAGGSIGNTTFAVTQATSSNLKAQVDPLTPASWGLLAQASTTSGQLGQLALCAATTAAPSYTTAQSNPMSCDLAGNLRVSVSNTNANLATNADGIAAVAAGAAGAGSPVNAANYVWNGSTWDRYPGSTAGVKVVLQASSGTDIGKLTANQSVNGAQVAGTATSVNSGTVDAGTQRVVLPTNQPNLPVIAGNTSAVNTIAASQTNQILSNVSGGGTGATGDYLSHCIIIPGTTSPGSFAILDNSTTVFTFPGGASSISSLVPIMIPIGSKSVSGGWKITNTTNVTGSCVGKFS